MLRSKWFLDSDAGIDMSSSGFGALLVKAFPCCIDTKFVSLLAAIDVADDTANAKVSVSPSL